MKIAVQWRMFTENCQILITVNLIVQLNEWLENSNRVFHWKTKKQITSDCTQANIYFLGASVVERSKMIISRYPQKVMKYIWFELNNINSCGLNRMVLHLTFWIKPFNYCIKNRNLMVEFEEIIMLTGSQDHVIRHRYSIFLKGYVKRIFCCLIKL